MWHPCICPSSGHLWKSISHKKRLPYLDPSPWLWWGLVWHNVTYPPLRVLSKLGMVGVLHLSLLLICNGFQGSIQYLYSWVGASWPGTKMESGRGNCPILPSLWGPFDLGPPSVWPSVWRLVPDIWSSKSLDLAAIDVIVVAMNWNSR